MSCHVMLNYHRSVSNILSFSLQSIYPPIHLFWSVFHCASRYHTTPHHVSPHHPISSHPHCRTKRKWRTTAQPGVIELYMTGEYVTQRLYAKGFLTVLFASQFKSSPLPSFFSSLFNSSLLFSTYRVIHSFSVCCSLFAM